MGLAGVRLGVEGNYRFIVLSLSVPRRGLDRFKGHVEAGRTVDFWL